MLETTSLSPVQCTYLVFESYRQTSSRTIAAPFHLLHKILTQKLDPDNIPEIQQYLPKSEIKWLKNWLLQVACEKANYRICDVSW
jgi:hypothetical protein